MALPIYFHQSNNKPKSHGTSGWLSFRWGPLCTVLRISILSIITLLRAAVSQMPLKH